MAIYSTVTLAFLVANDSDKRGKKIDVLDTDTDSTTYSVVSSNRIDTANGATDEALAFSGVSSAKLFYLKSSEDITIKLNGSSDALSIRKDLPVFLPATVTACTVTNSSGSTANIDYGVVG